MRLSDRRSSAAQPPSAAQRPSAGPRAERSFRPDVEGMRAIAVAMVVVYHANARWLRGGFVGVDVFFVLSGFLITGLLIREVERSGRVSIAGFYARRARRIRPASGVVLAVTVVASHALLDFIRADTIAVDGRWAALFSANFRFLSVGVDYLHANEPPSPLQHFWSLAVEEQFYIVWPLLILAVGLVVAARWQRRVIVALLLVLIGASLWLCIRQTGTSATTAYFSPFTRAWELGVGALVAAAIPVLLRAPRAIGAVLSWVGLAMVAVSAAMFSDNTPFPGSAALLPVVGAALVVAGGTIAGGGASGAELILHNRPFLWLGRLSFSIYLWHFPLLVITAAVVGHPLGAAPDGMLIVASVGLAALTFRFVEDPLRHARFLAGDASRSLAFGAVLLLAVTAVPAYFVNQQLVQFQMAQAAASTAAQPVAAADFATSTDVVAAVGEASRLSRIPSDVQPPVRLITADRGAGFDCLVSATVDQPRFCDHGDLKAGRRIVVIGDSHAAAWIPALDAIGQAYGWRITQATKSNCSPAQVHEWDDDLKQPWTACDTWRSATIRHVQQLRPDLVLMAFSPVSAPALVGPSGQPTGLGWPQAYGTGTAGSINQLKPYVKHVFVVGDVPKERQDLSSCLAGHTDPRACAAPVAVAYPGGLQEGIEAGTKSAGGTYIAAQPWFCTATTCPPVISNRVTIVDLGHMTATYSTYLAGALATAMGIGADTIAQSVEQAARLTRLPALLVPSLRGLTAEAGGSDPCLAGVSTAEVTPCRVGDASARRVLVLFGDDHASRWAVPLDHLGRRYHWKVVQFTKTGCSAATLHQYRQDLHGAYAACDRWRTAAIARIRALRPALVVMASSAMTVTLTDASGNRTSAEVAHAVQVGIAQTARELANPDSRAVVLGDTPMLSRNPAACLAAQTDPQRCATSVGTAYRAGLEEATRAGATTAGATFVSVRPWFCTSVTCPAVIAGRVTQVEAGHLSTTYAEFLAPELATALTLTG